MEKVKIEFDQHEMAIINAALIELPYKHVIQLITSINEQINEQINKNEK